MVLMKLLRLILSYRQWTTLSSKKKQLHRSGTNTRTMAEKWILVISELRRVSQLSYKSDIITVSGLDEEDKKAIDRAFPEVVCQQDTDDDRFVLKGPLFNAMKVVNILTTQRGFTMKWNPTQHNIPLKPGNHDDRFAMLYHLSKTVSDK